MKIEKIINSKTTGYASALSLGCAIISGISKNKGFGRYHKQFAYTSLALTALHIGITEHYNNKYKKM